MTEFRVFNHRHGLLTHYRLEVREDAQWTLSCAGVMSSVAFDDFTRQLGARIDIIDDEPAGMVRRGHVQPITPLTDTGGEILAGRRDLRPRRRLIG